MPYNLPKKLNKSYSAELLKKVDNFLFDCDGVIWDFPNALPGSVECINKLKDLGKRCFFVTNNSTKTREKVLNTIKTVGIKNVTEDDVVCTAWILAGYLKSMNFKDKVYVIGTAAVGKELDAQGIRHLGIGPNIHEYPDPDYDFRNKLELDTEVKCVTVGFDPHFNYPKIVIGTSYVEKNPDCMFICTNDDAVLPTNKESKATIPGTGTMVNAMRTSITSKEPVIIGKPHKTMWEVLSKIHDLDASRTCIVGDRLDTDISFAATNDLACSFAVLSGVTNEQEIHKMAKLLDLENGDHKKGAHLCPDYYAGCLGDFEKFMK